MATLIAQVPISFVADGDLVSITRITSELGLRKEVTITGKIRDMTEKRHGGFATYLFSLIEADGTQHNLCGLDRWIVTLHIPFWDDFNAHHDFNMGSWRKEHLALYRTWVDVLTLNGRCRFEMVDRYVEALISGTSCPAQNREAYLHFANGNV